MTELEKYRDKKSEEYPFTYEDHSCEPFNHVHDCACGNDEEGFKAGFDSCLALQLTVRFSEWKDKNFYITHSKTEQKYYPHIGSPHFNISKLIRFQENATISLDELYEYWVTNIYKPE